MPTYESGTLSVSDGGITEHDTSSVADRITISNAECRWRGVETESTETEDEQPSNTSSRQNISQTSAVTLSRPTFDHPTETEFEYIELEWLYNPGSLSSDATIDVQHTFFDEDGNITITSDPSTHLTESGLGPDLDTIATRTEDFSTSFYDFPADAASVNLRFDEIPYEMQVAARYTVHGTRTYTATHLTTDPFVTRDVDGSYTGSLAEGEWSSWVSLSGVSEGVNEFYHNISGSNQAEFEFRYDWAYKYPQPTGGELRLVRDGTIYRVALADPGSQRLDYTHVRASVNGSVYAIDVVDVADSDAVPGARIGTPQGVVAPRAFDTV